MNFASPASLFFFLLALPIIALYLLKIRRREIEISSTLLWQLALRDRQAIAPWQKLRRNLLLLLQLIMLSGLVLALARLAIPVPVVASGAVILILDGSASMQSTDLGPSRFDRAMQITSELARDAGADTTLTGILAGQQARILFAGTRNTAEIEQILAGLKPSTGEADWAAALALAAGIGNQQNEEPPTFIIISDGGLPPDGLPPLPGAVRYLPVGSSADNLAIAAFDLRTLPGLAPTEAELFIRVSNYGDDDRVAFLAVTADNDTQILNQQLSVAAGESVVLTIPHIPAAQATFTARLSNLQAGLALDSLALDDVAFASLAPPAERRVFLVSPGNLFLERLLLLLPHVQPLRVVPDKDGHFNIPEDVDGLYIFDGVTPAGGYPPTDLLILNPEPNPLFSVIGETETVGAATVAEHALTKFLEWQDIHILKTRLMAAPPWADVLVSTAATPLIFAGEEGGRRIAVVGFDLHHSDLPLQVAFPILFSTLIDYLAPQRAVEAGEGLRVFDGITITAGPETTQIEVAPPEGNPIPVGLDSIPIIFQETGTPGLYEVRVTTETGTNRERVAVNAFSALESDIRVAEEIRVGTSVVTSTRPAAVSNRELWAWILGLTLGFFMLEWLAYHRPAGRVRQDMAFSRKLDR